MNPALRWIAIGVAGVALAMALAFMSSHLINEPVGLSSEPTTAGDRLAPPSATGSTTKTGNGGDGSDASGKSDGDGGDRSGSSAGSSADGGDSSPPASSGGGRTDASSGDAGRSGSSSDDAGRSGSDEHGAVHHDGDSDSDDD